MDYTPGERIKKLAGKDKKDVEAVVGQMSDKVFKVPDNPGPAITGRTPILGQYRRENDMTVLRDRLGNMLD